MGFIKQSLAEDRAIRGEGTPLAAWKNSQGLNQLAILDIPQLFPDVTARICIIAPHPDDEILGCGGLIQQLDALGYSIVIFAVTNGTASHTRSKRYTPEHLDQLRPLETLAALSELRLRQAVQRIALNLPDGQVQQYAGQLYQSLNAQLSPSDILVSTFVHDGHPDHEATGHVVSQLAQKYNCPFLQVMIWAWHWALPNDPRLPWQHAQKCPLSAQQLQRKINAVHCFSTQIEADEQLGYKPVLSPTVLERVLQPYEVYFYDPLSV